MMRPICIPSGWTSDQTDAVLEFVFTILDAVYEQYPDPMPDFSVYDIEEVGGGVEGEQS